MFLFVFSWHVDVDNVSQLRGTIFFMAEELLDESEQDPLVVSGSVTLLKQKRKSKIANNKDGTISIQYIYIFFGEHMFIYYSNIQKHQLLRLIQVLINKANGFRKGNGSE